MVVDSCIRITVGASMGNADEVLLLSEQTAVASTLPGGANVRRFVASNAAGAFQSRAPNPKQIG